MEFWGPVLRLVAFKHPECMCVGGGGSGVGVLFLTETGRASPVSELSGMTAEHAVFLRLSSSQRVVKHVNLYFHQFCRYVF